MDNQQQKSDPNPQDIGPSNRPTPTIIPTLDEPAQNLELEKTKPLPQPKVEIAENKDSNKAEQTSVSKIASSSETDTEEPHLISMLNNSKEEEKAQDSIRSTVSSLITGLKIAAGAILLAIIVNSFILQSSNVSGGSMEPTLQDSDRLLVYKFNKTISKVIGKYVPKRGEIIVFQPSIDSDTQFIKRVIGLPGERVVVENGVITVYNQEFPNGFNPDESYADILPPSDQSGVDTVVGPDEIFVSGDNRAPGFSKDSRSGLGNIPLENIVGRAIFRVFPISKTEFL